MEAIYFSETSGSLRSAQRTTHSLPRENLKSNEEESNGVS
jgi:hypothetical protein